MAANIPADLKAILARKPAARSPAELARLTTFARDNAPELKPDRDAVASAAKARTALETSLPHVLMTKSGPPRTVRILARGNWMDTTGPVMTPNTPGFLPPLLRRRPDALHAARSGEVDGRAREPADRTRRSQPALEALLRPRHRPLARGIGHAGAWPTHPELLDWLASEFQTKWDVKHMVRLMVTSATYRQSSVETPAVRERDPANQLFARQSRYRLDAEFVRDTALSVSGLLNRQDRRRECEAVPAAGLLGGAELPGPRVAEGHGAEGLSPRHVHPLAAVFPAPGDDRLRRPEPRGMHLRAAAVEHPAAGARAPERPGVRRGRARLRAEDARRRVQDDAARIAWAFERATGRKPKAAETAVLVDVLAKHRKEFAAKPDDAKKLLAVGDAPAAKDMKPEELAAWTSVCRVILNLHETISRQ